MLPLLLTDYDIVLIESDANENTTSVGLSKIKTIDIVSRIPLNCLCVIKKKKCDSKAKSDHLLNFLFQDMNPDQKKTAHIVEVSQMQFIKVLFLMFYGIFCILY